MAEILRGKEVAAAINERAGKLAAELAEKGVKPTLAIVRVGEKEDDISYERGAVKRCSDIGVQVISAVFSEDVTQEDFYFALDELNSAPGIHGILMLRPLPKPLDNEKARNYIAPEKDVDGCTDGSLAGIFTNSGIGFAPCTAQAAVEVLDHYGIDPTGKNITVLGRSLVVGKPLALMLMNRNATVTVCHTRTVGETEIAKRADILIAAIGKMEHVGKDYVSPGQTVIDVGISSNTEKKKLCGDCLFEEVEPIVDKITPVPGGVGSVTTAVLVSHVVEAAAKSIE